MNKLLLIAVVSILLFSCRKKEEKYEGIYYGTERQSIHDSAAINYALDTTYYQEFHVTYAKKYYTIVKSFNDPNNGMLRVYKNDIIDHEYYPFGEIYEDSDGNTLGYGSYLKLSGDSLYFNSSSSFNWEFTNFEFAGKRN